MPLVSCIMPTRNRRRFVSQAIWYFLRQDYSPRELIIIDDGEDTIADLVPNDERIRYVRLDPQLPLDQKRNLACELSQGDLIAHWDDDDWMASNRLSVQVTQLLAANADACGIRDLWHYRLDEGQAWLYRHPAGTRPLMAGGTLLYRRSVWEASRFPETNVGEDSLFIRQIPADRFLAISDTSIYIALLHAGNSTARNLNNPLWQQHSFDEISRLLDFDHNFYVALRYGRATQTLDRLKANVSPITLAATFVVYDGYGSIAEYLALSLVRAGANVHLMPFQLDNAGTSTEFQEILRRSQPDPNTTMLCYAWWGENTDRFRTATDLFIKTVWETNRLPADWPTRLNRARAVIVPSQFAAHTFRESGVTVPVEVVYEGINPEVYHYQTRPDRLGITTLIVGVFVPRKNIHEGIAAWKMAFANDPDARLIIKSRFQIQPYVPDDPRIQFVDTNETTRGILHWYRQADVLLALGNEGFGLPLIEGMATGLPVIALNSEAQAEVCETARGCLLPVEPARWQPVDEAPFGPCGVRAIPHIEEVATQLRWVADHRAEARTMGQAASAWALQHRNIWTMGPAILNVMERHARTSRSLRRTYTLWAPGVLPEADPAIYTAHLAATLPLARLSPGPPNVQKTRLVHIQHDHGVSDDVGLTRYIQYAHAHGVPVALTEHTVTSQARAWEREVDVLVCLTAQGADRLRGRWPAKRVELLPVGCPTWFPPRKSTQDCTIGVFGALTPEKGCWHLLEMLREVEETELLIVNHAQSVDLENQWLEAAKGLPIRWVSESLSETELVHRLAAEADLLVFWYEDCAHAATSYAARIGLATGTPVLTSPTSWFRDLDQVTYQPANLVEGVQQLLDDRPLRDHLTAAARDYCYEHSWIRVAERHLALWRTLENM